MPGSQGSGKGMYLVPYLLSPIVGENFSLKCKLKGPSKRTRKFFEERCIYIYDCIVDIFEWFKMVRSLGFGIILTIVQYSSSSGWIFGPGNPAQVSQARSLRYNILFEVINPFQKDYIFTLFAFLVPYILITVNI